MKIKPHVYFRVLLVLHLVYLLLNHFKIPFMKNRADILATLSGLAAAILIAWQPVATAWATNGNQIDYKQLGVAAFIASLGYLSNKFKPEEKK